MNFSKFKEDPKSHCPSPNEVMKAARDNPYSLMCIELWGSGKCTWEEALQAAVVAIIEHVAEDPLGRRKVTADKLPESLQTENNQRANERYKPWPNCWLKPHHLDEDDRRLVEREFETVFLTLNNAVPLDDHPDIDYAVRVVYFAMCQLLRESANHDTR